MVISKNLKEYAERIIQDKIRKIADDDWERKTAIFNSVKDELDAIEAKALDKCIKILEEKGLEPEDFDYRLHGECGFPRRGLNYARINRVSYSRINNIVQEVLLKIELDEIPKNEIQSYIENYDVSKYVD